LRSSAILGHPLTGAARCADRRRVVTVYCGMTPCAQFTPETANPCGNATPVLIDLIFLSPDFISISIGFPYRIMGLLY
jgi:hypothetical protein